ncbi:MAG: hypothetical protein RLZZ158_540 [Cyanobacteriota bacterium]|jgi:hypothetical protein
MDRVFKTLEPSGSRAESPRAESLSALPSASPKPPRLSTPVALVIGLTLVSAVAGLFSVLLWRSWMEARQDLHQERQLLVLERLRQLGPLSAPNPTLTAPPPQPAPQLPQPASPQQQPLQQLPTANPEPGWFEPVAPIRVPVPAARPAAQAPAPLPLPELLGVVQVPGRGGTAIFNTTTGSITAAVGETIGSSGWQLQSVGTDQVQVSHQGLVRSLSLSGR